MFGMQIQKHPTCCDSVFKGFICNACFCRGAFSYVKRVTEKKGKLEYAAKFISARAKRKASALREMELRAELDHERILYFHDAFEKKNVVVIITELYPFSLNQKS